MRERKKIIIVSVIALCLLFALGYTGINYYRAQKVVAKVGGNSILNGELIERANLEYGKLYYSQNSDLNKPTKEKIKKETLDSLINEKIMMINAQKLGLLPKDDVGLRKDVDKRVQLLLPSENEQTKFIRALKKYGVGLNEFKNSIEKMVILEKIQQEIIARSKVTEKQARDFYKVHKMDYASVPTKLNISSIRLASMEAGNKVLDRLNKGEKFSVVAKEFSQDESTRDIGGRMGWVKINDDSVATEFLNAANGLAVGKYSNIVDVNRVKYIIMLNGRAEGKYKPFESVKDEIMKRPELATLNNELQTREWKEKTKVEVFS